MYLVKNGEPQGMIGIQPMAPEPVRFAATELQRYLQRATGAFLPVCTESRSDIVLSVGIDGRLADEEFEVVSQGGGVAVQGGSGLGAVYGAYHLLKRHCGILFAGFGPEGEHVPQRSSVEVTEGTERRKPLLWYRGTQFTCVGEIGLEEMPSWREGAIQRIDWMAKNGMNFVLNWPAEVGGKIWYQTFTWRSDTEFEWRYDPQPAWITSEWFRQNLWPEIRKRGLKVEVGTHNMALFLPPAVYFDQHPEYYALRDGQRSPKRTQLMICTSNQEAVEEYTQNVLRYLEENPYIDILGLAQEDGFGMCECEECRKLDDPRYDGPGRKVEGWFLNGGHWGFTEHQNKIRRYARLVNYTARRIKEKFPTKKVNACFYVDMSWPPADIPLEDNVVPHVAMYIRCASHRYDDPACPMNSGLWELAQEWAQAAPGRVYFTEYYQGKSAYRSLPYPIAHRVAEDWRLFAALGISGPKIQHVVACNEAYALNTYTFARRAWDLEEPFERILDDFLTGRFGRQAGKIKPIYQQAMQRMDQLGQQGRCYHPNPEVFLTVFNSEEVERAQAMVEQALVEECTPRERVQLDRFRTLLEFVERFRALHQRVMAVKEEEGNCDRATYEEGMEFLAWEKQHLDTGYFAWGNDIYQWKNTLRNAG